MTPELKLVTWLYCNDSRVTRQIWKGGRMIVNEDLCMECDGK